MAVRHPAYRCTVQPFVQNREQIEVVITVFTEHREGWFYYYDEGRAQCELDALSESAVNRWALQFQHADEAVNISGYDALQNLIRELPARHCTITRAIVSKIRPLTDPPPKPQPPPPTMKEGIEKQLNQKKDATRFTNDWRVTSKKNDPDVWADPEDASIFEKSIEIIKNKLRGQVYQKEPPKDR
jgi:hypothetical protein